jgi:hypothetical protein
MCLKKKIRHEEFGMNLMKCMPHISGTYPPFLPPNHGMPADISTSYSNGIGAALHNNISPNNIAFNHRNLFQGDPHANPAHAAHVRPALGNSTGGKP